MEDAVIVNGYVSAVLPGAEAAMLALANRTSRPVRIPLVLREKVREGVKVIVILDGLEVVDWTVCG